MFKSIQTSTSLASRTVARTRCLVASRPIPSVGRSALFSSTATTSATEPTASNASMPDIASITPQFAADHVTPGIGRLSNDLIIEKGKGTYVWTTDGKKWLDFTSGIVSEKCSLLVMLLGDD